MDPANIKLPKLIQCLSARSLYDTPSCYLHSKTRQTEKSELYLWIGTYIAPPSYEGLDRTILTVVCSDGALKYIATSHSLYSFFSHGFQLARLQWT
jgi:hypothetical protein